MTEKLFHYTSMTAARSIVSSHSFWATNYTTFKDTNELFGGLNPIISYFNQQKRLNGLSSLLNQLLSDILKNQSMYNFYCISFCTEADSVFMKEHYAKNGCCLVFDKMKLLKSFLGKKSSIPKVNEYLISVVSDKFIPCNYLIPSDIEKQINCHLERLKLTQTINEKKQTIPFDYSTKNVIIRQLLWDDVNDTEKAFDDLPSIGITENLINLINPALHLKFAETPHKYECEKEERIVLVTSSNIPEKMNGNKRYIEIKLNPDIFFDALLGIKIYPETVDKTQLLDELKSLNDELVSRKIISKAIDILP